MDNSIKSTNVLNDENLCSILDKNHISINEYFENAINNGLEYNLFELFDKYLLNLIKQNANNTEVILSRILSLCSQFNGLCTKSKIKCIENTECVAEYAFVSKHFDNYETFNSGIKCLTQFRNTLGIGNKIVSDLYDSCVNSLIKKCVKTCFDEISNESNNSSALIPINEWVVAESGARIDLFGGWTDTPPICYEMGGAVLNVAINVNHEKPIAAKARKVELNSQTMISIKEYDLNRQLITDLKLNNIQDFSDYCKPDSCGALIKSALICCQIVDLNDDEKDLYKQLKRKLMSGLEIELWSHLPQGSGLGTSSILLSCVIAVLWIISGKQFTKTALINAVLYTEQLLTTGGGWQDQIGGIVGGVKLGRSEASLPLKIHYKTIAITESFRIQLEKHLMLIYSGTVRLAKNLLQTVIQNWYIRDQRITGCFNQLLAETDLCLDAFIREDMKGIGELLTKYWQLKKVLATNSEPKHVSQFLKSVEPYIYGGSLCGAGGGGFVCLVVKDIAFKEEINSMVKQYLSESQIYDCLIDESGLEITVNDITYNAFK